MRIAGVVLIGLALLALLLPSLPVGIFSGGSQPTPDLPTPPKPDVAVTTPAFNRDSAFAYVAAQVAFGARVPGSKAHKACGSWLIDKFKSFGAQVVKQDFTAKVYTGASLPAFNIVASYNPQATDRLIFAAHWDSRHQADQDSERQKEPILGADDGASGVGVLLEMARLLQLQPLDPGMGIDFVLFDAEDHGNDADNTEAGALTWCLGSQHWSANFHVPGYRARYGVLLDMVGAPGARFAREAVSVQFAPDVLDRVWRTARTLGYGNHFVMDTESGITDDHLFVNRIARIPMIDIINRPLGSRTGFVPHWHTHNDDMRNIDPQTLHAVGHTLITLIYKEAAGVL
jgi:hypothetical protein